MTLKKTVKAILSALLYFGIYFVWQGITGFWAGLGYSVYAVWRYGEVADISTLATQFALDYSLHITLIANVLALVTYIFVFRMRKMNFTREVGFTRLGFVPAAVTFLLGLALNLFVAVAISFIPFPEAWWRDYEYLASTIPEAPEVITLLSVVIMTPVIEEVVLRGLFYGRLKRGMPMFAAMLISSWLFGLIHGTPIWIIYASLMGFILVWIYEKYRSLIASVLFHFGFNLGGFVLGYLEDVPSIAVIASFALSVGLIAYVQRTAPGKIEFTVPKADITDR